MGFQLIARRSIVQLLACIHSKNERIRARACVEQISLALARDHKLEHGPLSTRRSCWALKGPCSDFHYLFGDNEDCLEWLEHLRWGSTRQAKRESSYSCNRVVTGDSSTFICPECGCPDALIINHGRRCRGCRHRVSVLSGTPFHQTKIALPRLLEAAWLITEPGIALNAHHYETMAGLTHENSWAILHKYREVMCDEMKSLSLTGQVEVDECFIGGKPKATWQFIGNSVVVTSQVQKKHIVLVAVEKRKGGRVVFKQLPSTQTSDIMPAVCGIVHNPSTILTDAKTSYSGLESEGYRHKVYNISQLPLPAHVYLPAVHSAASNTQRWLLKAINRYPASKHMDYYLAEAAFRFNHRTCRNRGLLFYRLMEATLQHGAMTQRDVVARTL